MKKIMFIAAILACGIASPAMAAQTNTGCQGNCPTDGGNGAPVTNTSTNTNANVALGVGLGVGGSGGAGGTGGSVKVGDTKLSNNLDNRNTNNNANVGVNKSRNDNTNTNVGINANRNSNANRNANKNSNENANENNLSNTNALTNRSSNQNTIDSRNRNNVNTNTSITTGPSTATSDQAQSQSTENSNNSSTTVVNQGDEAQDRNPVSSAFAAPLVTSNDTCMGSSSMGAQGIGFGLSIGSTWTDKNCIRLKNARELQVMGQSEAAIQLMCLNPDIRKAMKAAGTPCEAIVRRRP